MSWALSALVLYRMQAETRAVPPLEEGAWGPKNPSTGTQVNWPRDPGVLGG